MKLNKGLFILLLKGAVVIGSIVSIAACSFARTSKSEYDRLDSQLTSQWRGHQLQSLINVLGQPRQTGTNIHGNRFAFYALNVGSGLQGGGVYQEKVGSYSGRSSGTLTTSSGYGSYQSRQTGDVYASRRAPTVRVRHVCYVNFWLDSNDAVIQANVNRSNTMAESFCERLLIR